MPQTSYRGNLTSAEFPFLSELQGRTVIIGGTDQNYSRQLSSNKNKDRDIGIPQIYYMHNVIATEGGVCSVGYTDIFNPPADTDSTFYKVFTLRDPQERVAYLGVTSSGRTYVLTDVNVGWKRTPDLSLNASGKVSVAHVNGQSYVCFQAAGTYKYNFTTGAFDAQALAGLNTADVYGVCASSGYMVAWTKDSIKWSSTLSPTDFVPSLVTGAGGQSLQEAKAEIVCCLPNNNGFIVYTKRNAVALAYSGNARYPFNAREIIGAGGLADASMAAYDGNSTNHLAYTTSGLQEISMPNANIFNPQATDFLAGSQFEDFDERTMQFSVIQIGTVMKKKVSLIANRYIVISYGRIELTHALVYDIALARWGKLKINHVECFEYFYPSSAVVDAPRNNIAFLQANGTIKIANLSYDTIGSNGVIILGKYQYERARYVNLQEIHLESIRVGNNLAVKVLTTVDGKNVVRESEPALAINNTTYRKYTCRATGLNHSIIISGGFHAHSLELKFADGGSVR